MAISPAKENILKKIREALRNPVPLPFPGSEGAESVFQPAADDLSLIFAQEFTKLQGNFAFCTGTEDLINQLSLLLKEKDWMKIYVREKTIISLIPGREIYSDLEGCDVSITGCEYLVARTGTIVMSSAQSFGRTTSVYAPVHICVAYTKQVVYDLQDSLLLLKEKYDNNIPSLITFASGPSRTADIEKTLVTGVHGPKEVYCFLVEI